MKKIAFLFILLFFGLKLHAQWQQTGGPCGGSVHCLLSDGGNLYAGLDLGGGIYKSVDDGETWAKTTLQDKTIHAFLKDGNKLFAATESGIYISSNNALSWTLSNTGITTFYNTSLTKSGTKIFVGTNQGIYVTANQGASWTNASAGLPNNCSIETLYTSGSRIFAGTGNGLFVSDDQGANWVHYANNATWADIMNENTVLDMMESQGLLFAATAWGLFYSEDNGDQWTLCDGFPLNESVYSLTNHNGILYAGTLRYGMYSSADNGASWTATNNNYRMIEMHTLIVHNDEIFTGTNTKGIFKTANGGLDWEIMNDGMIETNISLMTGNATTMFAGAYGHNVFRSEDEGNTWEPVVFGIGTYMHTLEIIGNKVFLGTESGLYVSENNGDTWSFVSGLGPVAIFSFASHNSKLHLGTSDDFLVSEDNGVTWTSMAVGLPEEWILSIVGVGSSLFITTDEGDIYKSEDNAVSWTLHNGNMPSNVGFLKYNAGRLIASTSSGIWFSTDLGQTWNSSMNPWQLGGATSMEIQDSRLFIGNYNGAYVLADNGAPWTEINEGFPAFTNVLVMQIRGNQIFAGTAMDGIWKRDLSEITVSVEEETLDQAVLYPNPFSGQATLNFGKPVKGEIQVCDISGKVLRSEAFSGDTFVIEQKHLRSGTYFLNVKAEGETAGSYKFVVL